MDRAGAAAGIRPGGWAHLGSLASFGAALQGTYRLGRTLLGNVLPALLALLIFGTNYTNLAYGTGGLETMLQTALLVWAMVEALRLRERLRVGEITFRPALTLGLLVATAVLTRPDSAAPGGLMLLAALFWTRSSRKSWLALVLPPALLVGAWLVLKASYYGDLLPNSFHAKTGGASLLANGLTYVVRYFHAYLLWPWIAYVVLVGGDFMEFRFFVPIAPFLAVLLAGLIHDALGTWVGHPRAAAAVALVAASVHYAVTFRGVTADRTLDSIETLSTFYGVYPSGHWDRLGRRLGEDLHGTGALLASRAVGAIPYYSRLRTVDMWGLNDPVVAEDGNPAPERYQRPGHRRHATLSYLRRRGVHLVIGHPTLIERGRLLDPTHAAEAARWVEGAIQFNDEPITDVTLVAMPVDGSVGLLMWYLTPDPRVDAAMAAHGWERQSFVRRPVGDAG